MDILSLFVDFCSDTRTRIILGLILVDVVTGIIAALRTGAFDLQRVAAFYRTMIIPGVLGYLLVWVLAVFGLDGVLPAVVNEGLNTLGATFLIASLLASVADNFQRANAGRPPNVPSQ